MTTDSPLNTILNAPDESKSSIKANSLEDKSTNKKLKLGQDAELKKAKLDPKDYVLQNIKNQERQLVESHAGDWYGYELDESSVLNPEQKRTFFKQMEAEKLAKPEVRERTNLEAIQDFGLSIAKGAVDVAQIPVQLAIAATDGAIGLGASQALTGARHFLGEQQSDDLKATREENNRLYQEEYIANQAEGILSGTADDTTHQVMSFLEEAGVSLEHALKNPSIIFDIAGEQIAGFGGAGLVGRASIKKALDKATKESTKEGAAKLTPEMKAKLAEKAGTRAGVVTGALQEGASVSAEAINEVLSMKFEYLEENSEEYRKYLADGLTPEQAREEVAIDTGVTSLAAGTVIGGFISKFTGAGKFEGNIFVPDRASLRKVAADTAKEGSEEFLQGTAVQGAANKIIQEKADETKEVRAGLGQEAGLGLAGGAAIGGSASAIKNIPGKIKDSAKKVSDNLKEKAASELPTESNIERTVKATPEDNVKSVDSLKDIKDTTERAQTAAGIALSINEYLNSGAEISEEKRNDLIAKRNVAKSIAIEATESIISSNKESADKVVASETESSKEDVQAAYAHHVSEGSEYSPDLAKKLSGSKHLTDSQKTLAKEITKPTSVVRKTMDKNRAEVAEDIFSGGEGFTGLEEYVSTINTAIATGDMQGTAAILNKLKKFRGSHTGKLKSGKFRNGDVIPADLLEDIKDETNAIGMVYDAMSDSATQTFPEIAEVLNKTKTTDRVSDLLGAGGKGFTKDNRERHTIPIKTRTNIIKNALSTVLDSKFTGKEGTEDSLTSERIDLASKFGVNESTIKEYKSAVEKVDSLLSKKGKLNAEERVELREANTKINTAYNKLVKGYGGLDNLKSALTKQGDEALVETAFETGFKPVELVTEVEEVDAHKPIPEVTGALSTPKQFQSYSEMVEQIGSYIEENTDTVSDEDLDTFSSLPDSLNALAENTDTTYNKAVAVFNNLKINNNRVRAASGDVKAKSTTPNNRTFQNSLEETSEDSVVGSHFNLAQPKNLGLIHTEEELFAKLDDKESAEYKHITSNMTEEEILTSAKVTSFVTAIQKSLNKILRPLTDKDFKKKDGSLIDKDKVTRNSHIYGMLNKDGKLDSNVSSALALGLGNWLQSNARGTLYNDDNDINDIMNRPEGHPVSIKEIKALRNAGSVHSKAVADIGKNALKIMGYTIKGDSNEAYLKQLEVSLGQAAVEAAIHSGNKGILEYNYVTYDKEGTPINHGNKRPTGTYTRHIKAVLSDKQDPVGEDGIKPKVKLVSKIENIIDVMSDVEFSRDILGVETDYVPVYTEEMDMPDAHNDSWNSPEQAEALNKNNAIRYELHSELYDLTQILDQDYKEGLVDSLPEEGTDHINNRDRNEAAREDIYRAFDGLENILATLKKSGSNTIRFFSRSSRKNKRMTQMATDGNVQNSKWVRHLMKPVNQRVKINPKKDIELLAYKMAVMEALDFDTVSGKSVDKSSDKSVTAGFEALLEDSSIMAAVDSIKSGNPNKDAIQKVLGKSTVKVAGSTNGTLIKLDGLVALAAYSPNESFDVFIGKENDGITNGIAIGLTQLAGATSYEDYVYRLAQTGVFVGNTHKGNGEFQEEGNSDSYVDYSNKTSDILENPKDNPFSEHSVFRQIRLNQYALFSVPWYFKKVSKKNNIKTLDGLGKETNVKRISQVKNKDGSHTDVLSITEADHSTMKRGISFFLNKSIVNSDGLLVSVHDEIEALKRDFAKNPLMIFNYGAGLAGLKKALAGKLLAGIASSIEEAVKLEPELQEEAFLKIEEAVDSLNFIPNYTKSKDGKWELTEWKINRETPLDTPIDNAEYNDALVAVEFTHGAAMDQAFSSLYGQYSENVSKIIQTTRIASALYSKALDRAIENKKKETGKDYITLNERKEIQESLKEYSPIIATAISENRLEDGVWIPKGENSKDTVLVKNDDGSVSSKPINSKTDEVKTKFDTGSINGPTYSNKIEDPGVSMGAVMTQSLDASVIVKTMLKTDFVNIHDAGIFNLLSNFKDTQSMNESFKDISNDYSLVDSVYEMLEGVISNPLLTEEDFKSVEKELSKTITDTFGEGNIEGVATSFSEFKEKVNHNRKLINKSPITWGQYYGGEQATVVTEATGDLTQEDIAEQWEDYQPKLSIVELFTKHIEKLYKSNKKAKAANVRKDLRKAVLATKYIGTGNLGSSTDIYRNFFENEGLANTGEYVQSDVVFVSANGQRKTDTENNRVSVLNPDNTLTEAYSDLVKVVEAGASVVTDSATLVMDKRRSSYNIGDNAVMSYLLDNSYVPLVHEGVLLWSPSDTRIPANKVVKMFEVLVDYEATQKKQTDSAFKLEQEKALKEDLKAPIQEAAPDVLEDDISFIFDDIAELGGNFLELPVEEYALLEEHIGSTDIEYMAEFLKEVEVQNTYNPIMNRRTPEQERTTLNNSFSKLMSIFKKGRSKNLGEIKEFIYSAYVGDKATISLINKIYGALPKDTSVKYIDSRDALPSLTLEHAHKVHEAYGMSTGTYIPQTNTIYLFAHKLEAGDTDQLSETLLHELDHAATTQKLFEDYLKGDGRSASYKLLEKVYRKLHDIAADPFNQDPELLKLYGQLPTDLISGLFLGEDLTDGQIDYIRLGELMSWGKTNREFMALLKSVPLTESGKTSLWDAVLKAASRLLGFAVKELNLYTTIIAASETYYDRTFSSTEVNALRLYNPRNDTNKVRSKLRDKLITLLENGVSYEDAIKKLGTTKARKRALETIKGFVKRKAVKPTEAQYQLNSDKAAKQEVRFPLDKSTASTIFDGLGDLSHKSNKPSGKVTAHLKNMLNIMVPAIDAMETKILMGHNEESSGEINGSGIQLTINTGAKISGIEMSPQETFVHEVAHAFLKNADKTSWEYRRIVRIYEKARKELTYKHFLGDLPNPSLKDIEDAKDRYNHTMHNAIEGGGEYESFLGNTHKWYNADPVEEFTVMALTNPILIEALSNMDKDLTTKSEGTTNKLINYFTSIFNKLTNKISGISDLSADKQMFALAENLVGIQNNKKNAMYRAANKIDLLMDKGDKGIKDTLASVTGYNAMTFLHDNSESFKNLVAGIKKSVRSAAGKSVLGKNKLAVSLANEFTIGRKGLAELTRLLAKSTYGIERKGQQLHDWVTKDLDKVFEGITDSEKESIFKSVLQTDISSLLHKYDGVDLYDLLTSKANRKAQISKLEAELKLAAPSAYRYMRAHSEDLGYFMAKGERLYAAGMYRNVQQIVEMWGYKGNKGNINVDDATDIVNELSSLYAVDYTDQSVDGLFDKDRFGTRGLEIVTAMHREIVQVARETSFKDNEFNMKKGYLREEFDAESAITVAPVSDKEKMLNQGYTILGSVGSDPLIPSGGEAMAYYANAAGTQDTHLTGVVSLASPDKAGTDVFKVGSSGSSLAQLSAAIDQDNLKKRKEKMLKHMFTHGGSYLKATDRSAVVDPTFDSKGTITGFRHITSNYIKDKHMGRSTDFSSTLGYTLAGINRRVETKRINEAAIDHMYQEFKKDFAEYPQEFILISADSKVKEERDAYKLLPEEARVYAETLFKSKSIMVRREQFDMIFGYKKFSVSQLKHDRSPAPTAFREILRHSNNLTATMFNNKVGITLEEYTQAFVATAKDTLVIKSGFVTAANIASNLVLLWWSGVSPAQAAKDHAEAYRGVYEFKRDEEKVFLLNQKLNRPGLSSKESRELKSEIAVLRQQLHNNPVRELIEAGMYQTIVDDVDVGEKAGVVRNKIDDTLAPIADKLPETVKTIGKNLLLTHDTKAYQVMRDMAQISDFAARYSLHKSNIKNGMEFSESIRDISSTFINYDIPSHKGIQYLNDVGLMGFTKYLFRVQYVLAKRLGERPAKLIITKAIQGLTGADIADPADAVFGIDALMNRFYSLVDWADMASQAAPIQLLGG